MEAKELRLGNHIDFNGMLSIVREIDEQGVVVDIPETNESEWIDLFQFTPIPLTENHLLHFGFILKYDSNGEYYLKGDVRVLILRLENKVQFYFGKPNSSDKYVHELQNYYFIHAGNEVTE